MDMESLRSLLDNNAGKVERTWGKQMYDKDDGAIPKLHQYMKDNDLSAEQALASLGTKYAIGTYNNDVRIWELRDREPIHFQLVINGEITNSEARKVFLTLQRNWNDKVRTIMKDYIKDVRKGKGTLLPAEIEKAVTHVKDKLEYELTEKEKRSITSWVKQGKVKAQAGSTKKRKNIYADKKVLKKALIKVSKVLKEELKVKMPWKKLVDDKEGAKLTDKIKKSKNGGANQNGANQHGANENEAKSSDSEDDSEDESEDESEEEGEEA